MKEKKSKLFIKKGKKVTDVFDVLNRMPEITIKHAFIAPILFVCGLTPIIVIGNQNNLLFWKFMFYSFVIVTVLSIIFMLIASREVDAEYRHIKMIFAFKEQVLLSMILSITLSVYYVFQSLIYSLVIVAAYILLRIIKIWHVEKRLMDII